MEFNILAGQINPHFLFNTLETIRMMAMTSGNSDVVYAIKLLAKSMRYTLEAHGTKRTSLEESLRRGSRVCQDPADALWRSGQLFLFSLQ